MKLLLTIYSFLISFLIRPESKQIQGIILPHHGLASEVYLQSFNKLKKNNKYSTIVIYGTNHYYPVGPLFTTTESVALEYEVNNIYSDNERILKEHSIQIPTEYIKIYFPDSKIVPLILGVQYGKNEIENTINELINKLPKDTLYLASVDFSHSTGVDEALDKNKESIEAIANFDYEKIKNFDNDYLDSPNSIYALLYTMEKLGSKKWTTWYSTHTGLLKDSFGLLGTSYVVGVFTN